MQPRASQFATSATSSTVVVPEVVVTPTSHAPPPLIPASDSWRQPEPLVSAVLLSAPPQPFAHSVPLPLPLIQADSVYVPAGRLAIF